MHGGASAAQSAGVHFLSVDAGAAGAANGAPCSTHGACAGGYCGYSDDNGNAVCGAAPTTCANESINVADGICCEQSGQLWGCASLPGQICGTVSCYPTCANACSCGLVDSSNNQYPQANTPTCYQLNPGAAGTGGGADDSGVPADAGGAACQAACAGGLTYTCAGAGLNFYSVTFSGGSASSCTLNFNSTPPTTVNPATIDCTNGTVTNLEQSGATSGSWAFSGDLFTVTIANGGGAFSCSLGAAAEDAGSPDAGSVPCATVGVVPGQNIGNGNHAPPICCSGHTNAGGACCSPNGVQTTSGQDTDCCEGTVQTTTAGSVCVSCLQVGDRSGTSANPGSSSCCSGKAGCNSQTGQCVCCDGC